MAGGPLKAHRHTPIDGAGDAPWVSAGSTTIAAPQRSPGVPVSPRITRMCCPTIEAAETHLGGEQDGSHRGQSPGVPGQGPPARSTPQAVESRTGPVREDRGRGRRASGDRVRSPRPVPSRRRIRTSRSPSWSPAAGSAFCTRRSGATRRAGRSGSSTAAMWPRSPGASPASCSARSSTRLRPTVAGGARQTVDPDGVSAGRSRQGVCAGRPAAALPGPVLPHAVTDSDAGRVLGGLRSPTGVGQPSRRTSPAPISGSIEARDRWADLRDVPVRR